MESLWQDIHYGVRMLLKKPGFSAVAVLTLALGIGANTAVFSIANAVLLRPLPYKEADNLMLLTEFVKETNGEASRHGGGSAGTRISVAYSNFLDWSEQNRSFERIAAYQSQSFNLTGADDPAQLSGYRVSAGFFSIMGVTPALGRAFLDEEDRAGGERVIIISYGLWQSRFGGDVAIIGRALTFNGGSYTVVGVMPSDFKFPDGGTQFWVPLKIFTDRLPLDRRAHEGMQVVGRLKADATVEQAQSDMSDIAQKVDSLTGHDVKVASLRETLVGNIRPALVIMLGAVGFVLLIACTNVANLTLAKAAAREREIAIRAALGARRLRMIRQLLTESLLLAALGGGLGLMLASYGIDLFIAFGSGNIPRSSAASIDGRVLGFTLVVSILTGVLFGLLPALQASKPNLTETLNQARNSALGFGRNRLRSLLVVSEVALALVLLVGAGLMMRSFIKLQQVDAGFNPESVLTMRIVLPKYRYTDAEKWKGFYRQVLDRVQSLPGVESAGITTILPLGGDSSETGVFIEGRPRPATFSEVPVALYQTVSEDYFRAMGIPLIEGRYFDERDNESSAKVTIIDETMARRFWPDESPVGKRIAFEGMHGGGGPVWREVIGVVRHVRHYGLAAEGRVELYAPYLQSPAIINMNLPGATLTARTSSDPSGMAATITSEVHAVDKDQPVSDVRTMERVMSDAVSQPRFSMILFGIFAVVAVALAALGIYGVVSYSVAQRTREIGIRCALGAQQGQVLRLVIGQGMKLTLAGLAIGIAGAFAVTRVLKSMLFGVSATDPVTFIIVSTTLVLVAFAACYIPARRAAKVDPMVALRYE